MMQPRRKKISPMINLTVILQSPYKKITLNINKHTFIKELGNIIAKEMDLDVFKTDFCFRRGLKRYTFNSPSSLVQCDLINAKETIYIEIEAIHSKITLNSNQTKEIQINTPFEFFFGNPLEHSNKQNPGMSVQTMCQNKYCVDYNQISTYFYGFGTYDLTRIRFMRCKMCPLDEKKKKISVQIISVIFFRCCYQINKVESDLQQQVSKPQGQKDWEFIHEIFETTIENLTEEWINHKITIKRLKM